MTLRDDSALSPVRRARSLRESVTERLRTAIVTGELAEGTVVSAPALGTQLGVSATPVREAMMDLSREGLVETLKNKGFRVTAITREELTHIAEVRLLIEPPSVGKVVGKVPPKALARLRKLADECLQAAADEDLQTYLFTDREFHALILEHTGNEFLVELATSLRRRTRMYGLMTLAGSGVLPHSAREHHELVDLIEAGDAAGAEALTYRHIGHSVDIWLTGLEESSAQKEGEPPRAQHE